MPARYGAARPDSERRGDRVGAYGLVEARASVGGPRRRSACFSAWIRYGLSGPPSSPTHSSSRREAVLFEIARARVISLVARPPAGRTGPAPRTLDRPIPEEGAHQSELRAIWVGPGTLETVRKNADIGRVDPKTAYFGATVSGRTGPRARSSDPTGTRSSTTNKQLGQ